jgi:hypothetical protein
MQVVANDEHLGYSVGEDELPERREDERVLKYVDLSETALLEEGRAMRLLAAQWAVSRSSPASPARTDHKPNSATHNGTRAEVAGNPG